MSGSSLRFKISKSDGVRGGKGEEREQHGRALKGGNISLSRRMSGMHQQWHENGQSRPLISELVAHESFQEYRGSAMRQVGVFSL